AVDVEQRLCLGRIELGERPSHLGVEAVSAGRNRRLRYDRLTVIERADPFLRVHGERDRAAQRYLLRRVAAHHGMLHAEVEESEIELVGAVELDLLLLQVRRKLAFGRREIDELERHFGNEIMLGVKKGEPARLRFLDD